MDYKKLEEKLEMIDCDYYCKVVREDLKVKKYFDILIDCYKDENKVKEYYYSLVQDYQNNSKRNKEIERKIFQLYELMKEIEALKRKKEEDFDKVVEYSDKMHKFALDYLLIRRELQK